MTYLGGIASASLNLILAVERFKQSMKVQRSLHLNANIIAQLVRFETVADFSTVATRLETGGCLHPLFKGT